MQFILNAGAGAGAALLAAALVLPAAAQSPVTADTVLATIGETQITAGHLQLLRAQLPQQYQSLPDEQLYQGLIEQIVQQSLLAEAAGQPDPRAQYLLDNQTRALMATLEMQKIAGAAVTEEAVQAAYAEAYGDAAPTPEYNASHILVDSEEAAGEVRTLLDQGANFAKVARERSTGPTGPNGGNLGWFGPGMMVPDFEAVVTGLKAGEISDPVQTQFGWHVIRLDETRMKEAPSLAEVEGDLIEEIQQQAIEETLAELEADAEISRTDVSEIDPSFLSNPDLLSQ